MTVGPEAVWHEEPELVRRSLYSIRLVDLVRFPARHFHVTALNPLQLLAILEQGHRQLLQKAGIRR